MITGSPAKYLFRPQGHVWGLLRPQIPAATVLLKPLLLFVSISMFVCEHVNTFLACSTVSEIYLKQTVG